MISVSTRNEESKTNRRLFVDIFTYFAPLDFRLILISTFFLTVTGTNIIGCLFYSLVIACLTPH